jgi:ribosomal protein S18 acetylase RimI-like enzyme
MEARDAEAVARAHAAAFPGYFLSRLGPRALAAMYGRLAGDPASAAFVACVGDDVVGFAAAVLDRRRFTHAFARRCWPTLAACIAARPGMVWQIASRLPRLARGGRAGGEPIEAATLLSIGVLPEFQGRGIGGRLMSACLQGLREQGARRVLLETDTDNAAANAFYLRCGFRLHREVRLEGARVMAEYLLELA